MSLDFVHACTRACSYNYMIRWLMAGCFVAYECSDMPYENSMITGERKTSIPDIMLDFYLEFVGDLESGRFDCV